MPDSGIIYFTPDSGTIWGWLKIELAVKLLSQLNLRKRPQHPLYFPVVKSIA